MIQSVRVALTRPLTLIVMSIVIAIAGTIAAQRTPVDIFLEKSHPGDRGGVVVSGLSAADMSSRIVTNHERMLTTSVNDIGSASGAG